MATRKILTISLFILILISFSACPLGDNGDTPPGDSGDDDPPSGYVLGGTGPGGGIIFFDKGQYDNKMWTINAVGLPMYQEHPTKTTGSFIWRYMEFAPKSTESSSCEWGASFKYYESPDYPQNRDEDIGGGILNTTETLQYHNELPDINPGKRSYYLYPKDYSPLNDGTVAAKYCDDLGYRELTDWFLPSINTLHKIFRFINTDSVGLQYSDDFELAGYWSSTTGYETGFQSHVLYFTSGAKLGNPNEDNLYVRAVRAF